MLGRGDPRTRCFSFFVVEYLNSRRCTSTPRHHGERVGFKLGWDASFYPFLLIGLWAVADRRIRTRQPSAGGLCTLFFTLRPRRQSPKLVQRDPTATFGGRAARDSGGGKHVLAGGFWGLPDTSTIREILMATALTLFGYPLARWSPRSTLPCRVSAPVRMATARSALARSGTSTAGGAEPDHPRVY
jgi:hypothetical protein